MLFNFFPAILVGTMIFTFSAIARRVLLYVFGLRDADVEYKYTLNTYIAESIFTFALLLYLVLKAQINGFQISLC